MMRFTSVLVSGIAVGLLLGAGATMTTDEKQRRQMMRSSRRALRKAGHLMEDMF